jgi:antitoxin component of MazEF toxin-antitoxin module
VKKIVIKFRPCKLQKGNTSFSLPLPPEWIHSVGVRKGDALSIETNEYGSLIICPISKDPKSQK